MRLFSFFNTNKESGNELKKSIEKSLTQEEIIKKAFSESEGAELSPSVLYYYDGLKDAPITSIRRAICVLKRKGIIEETGRTTLGLYGKRERTYKASER